MSKASWIEASLVVDGELAEAVAEVLARFAPGGVVVETTAVGASDDDAEGYPVGPLRVYGYLPMDENIEESRRRLEESLWYLGRIRPLPAAQFRLVEETNWAEAWKQHYRPIAIGRRLMIVPAWLESPAPERIAIRIDPGMAFGTGTHPTTQLCLETLEAWLDSPAGQSWFTSLEVIDVGCGTAILAVAAIKLGARHALGVDIDPQAIKASQENAAANMVSSQIELGLGSVAEIVSGNFSIRTAPVVFANILAPVLIRLLDDGLASLLDPGGALVLSGILDDQAERVVETGQGHGLFLVERRQIGDWVALWMSK